MEVKTKENRTLHLLCAMLILLACCFRTGAVLQEDRSSAQMPQEETFYYVAREEEENQKEALPSQDREDPLSLTTQSPEAEIDNRCGAEVDMESLLQRQPSFHMTDSPCVLILHTHGTEAYAEEDNYRSEDSEKNVIRVGKEIADALNAAGIPTLHDTVAYDLQAGYNAAYEETAETIAAYLDKYPGLQVIIDVHRDGVSDGQGGQKPLLAQLEGESAAAMMLVMGTDTGELPHENWEDNLAFALKLQCHIREQAPDLMRKINLRGSRYNQHFTPCSILLEVGTAGNTLEEALRSGKFFGEALAQLLILLSN